MIINLVPTIQSIKPAVFPKACLYSLFLIRPLSYGIQFAATEESKEETMTSLLIKVTYVDAVLLFLLGLLILPSGFLAPVNFWFLSINILMGVIIICCAVAFYYKALLLRKFLNKVNDITDNRIELDRAFRYFNKYITICMVGTCFITLLLCSLLWAILERIAGGTPVFG